jgi:hypothetical protein
MRSRRIHLARPRAMDRFAFLCLFATSRRKIDRSNSSCTLVTTRVTVYRFWILEFRFWKQAIQNAIFGNLRGLVMFGNPIVLLRIWEISRVCRNPKSGHDLLKSIVKSMRSVCLCLRLLTDFESPGEFTICDEFESLGFWTLGRWCV